MVTRIYYVVGDALFFARRTRGAVVGTALRGGERNTVTGRVTRDRLQNEEPVPRADVGLLGVARCGVCLAASALRPGDELVGEPAVRLPARAVSNPVRAVVTPPNTRQRAIVPLPRCSSSAGCSPSTRVSTMPDADLSLRLRRPGFAGGALWPLTRLRSTAQERFLGATLPPGPASRLSRAGCNRGVRGAGFESDGDGPDHAVPAA